MVWWEFPKMCNVTYSLFVIGKDMMRPSFTKMCNVAHFLLVIGKYVMRLLFTKCVMSLTRFWLWGKVWWDYLFQNVMSHSLPVGHRKGCNQRLPVTKNVQCHSQAVGHRKCDETVCHKNVQCCLLPVAHMKRVCDEIASHKTCNVTHKLLVIGIDVIRLPFTNMCHNTAHLLLVIHRNRCDVTALHKVCNTTHSLLVIWKDVIRLPFTKCEMPLTTYQSYKKMCCLSQMCAMPLTSCWS